MLVDDGRDGVSNLVGEKAARRPWKAPVQVQMVGRDSGAHLERREVHGCSQENRALQLLLNQVSLEIVHRDRPERLVTVQPRDYGRRRSRGGAAEFDESDLPRCAVDPASDGHPPLSTCRGRLHAILESIVVIRRVDLCGHLVRQVGSLQMLGGCPKKSSWPGRR